MIKYKLANVLFDESAQFLEAPTLLVRSTRAFHRSDFDSSVWQLNGPGEHDFTTFFNALSVRKWMSYTVAESFSLHLELCGSACKVQLTRADEFSWDAEELSDSVFEISASEEWQVFDIPLPSLKTDVLESFKIHIGEGSAFIRNAFYYTEVDEAHIRNVELALCTTTFKKESYIEHNIELVKSKILATDEPVAGCFTQHVVDNGRSLNVAALEAERVHIYPNQNVGGAGGYARGMIAAMRQKPEATHVLLMDDDVVIQPESIIRTFNLLSLVNDEHAGDFVSGAMMDLFEPDVRWEDTGYVTFDGGCVPLKGKAHVGHLHETVTNEVLCPRPDQHETADHIQSYAGWWYCVIPMTAIKAYGLPLPVFVRYDDIEYALRCKAKFMTMNGICLWHPSFVRRYSAAVERYQVNRNALVAQFSTGVAPMANFIKRLYHMVQLELKKFNYTNASLVLDGFEDFLKGPEFLVTSDAAERAFMEANRHAEKLVPLEELREQLDELGVDLLDIVDVDAMKENDVAERRSFSQRVIDYITFNGQRIDMGYVKKDTYAVIDVAGWLYPADRIRRKDMIIAIDLENRCGVVRRLDRNRFGEIWRRYKKDMKQFRRDEKRLREAYAAAGIEFCSVEFWEKYLGLEQ